jgi:hypothetical protein
MPSRYIDDGSMTLPDLRRNVKAAVLRELKQMTAEKPPGTLHQVVNLRRRLPGVDKFEFDLAVLCLANDDGPLVIHYHDLPKSLSQSKRDELVHDWNNDMYYIGVAFKHGR